MFPDSVRFILVHNIQAIAKREHSISNIKDLHCLYSVHSNMFLLQNLFHFAQGATHKLVPLSGIHNPAPRNRIQQSLDLDLINCL